MKKRNNLVKNLKILITHKFFDEYTTISKQLNISRQTLSKYCNGLSSPSTDNLIILSEYFKLSIDDLIYGEVIYYFSNNNVYIKSFGSDDEIIVYKK